MHDNIMFFQLGPLVVIYIVFLAALDWVQVENAPVRKPARVGANIKVHH